MLTGLKESKEHADKLSDACLGFFPFQLSVERSNLCYIRTLRGPERRTAKADQDRGWIHQCWLSIEISRDEGQVAELTDDNRPFHTEDAHLVNR